MCIRIFILTLALAISSCLQPVRKNFFSARQADEVTQSNSPVQHSVFSSPIKPRFSDTMYLAISTIDAKLLHRQFDDAQNDFDEGKFAEARKKFGEISETLDESDSLHFESIFMSGECDVQLSDFKYASDKLQTLLNQKMISVSLKERVIVRLGQVCCAMDNKNDAAKMFARLITEFPDSKFLKVASCDAIRGK